MQGILNFGEYVYSDSKNRDEGVTKALISLLGDMATQIEGIGILFSQKSTFIQGLISEAKYSNNPELVESANWASLAISQAVTSAGQNWGWAPMKACKPGRLARAL